jgi:hypothetical protein
MASIGGTLGIPESTVVGAGTYVIPVNRYAFLNMTCSSAAYATTYGQQSNAGSANASANSSNAWLVSGDTITTSQSFPTFDSTGTANTNELAATTLILVNGQVACAARSGIIAPYNSGQALSARGRSTGNLGWTVSLFRIPKANLPVGAAEGE